MKNKILILSLLLLAQNSTNAQKYWTDSENYFAVYRFSDDVMGLTYDIEIGLRPNEGNMVDSIFHVYEEKDSLLYVIWKPVHMVTRVDTTHIEKFYKHQKLSDDLMRSSRHKFYVYCTKGMVEREGRDVVYKISECSTNYIVMRFDSIDTSKYGQPIFCSEKKLELTYGTTIDYDLMLEKHDASIEYYYQGHLPPRVFAFNKDQIFTYSDDFTWNYSEDDLCVFPSREIFKVSGRKLESEWAHMIDLFGMPCD